MGSNICDKGGVTMNYPLPIHPGFWAKAAILLFCSLMLTLLPDWGTALRAQIAPPPPTLLPPQVNFGDITVGTVSASQTVTLTNNDLQIPMLVNSVSTAAGFSATSSCPASLGPQASCNISVTFSPTTIGPQTGTLDVVVDTCSDDCIETLSTGLTGNGVALINAVDDTASTLGGTPVTINVLANDGGTGLTVVTVSAPANGNAVISGNAVTYTPAAAFAGTDTFTYTIRDSFGQTDTATVTVTVNPPGLNAVDDTASTPAGMPVTINVLGNDGGTGLTVVTVSAPVNGNAVISGSGVTYTPAATFAGTDTFTYTIRDGFGQTDTATVRITVIAPVLEAVNDTATTSTGTPVTIPVLANDIGERLTIIQVGNPEHGSATINADNTITYVSTSDFIGVDTFTYTITDRISVASAAVTVTVTRSKEDVQKLLEDTTNDLSTKTVGRAIGGLCFDGAASTDFLRDCNTLIDAASASDPQVGSALEQITPKSLTAAVDASQTSVQSQMLGIRSRMAALRSGVMGINLDQLNIQRGGWTFSGRDLRYLLASVGGEIGVPSADIGADLGPFGVFASGAINLGNRDQTENQTGFDFKTLELILGADYRFSNQSILGVALSYNATDTDMDSNGGYLDSRGYGLTFYGVHYLSDQLYVEGMVNYGRNNYDQQRNVAYQLSNVDVQQRFDSSYGGQQFFADAGVGYQFTHGNLTLTPEARLSYLDVRVDPFQEHAFDSNPGSAWAVAVDEQNLQSLVSSLGGRASYLLNQSWGTLEPQIELSWLHEFKDNNQWLSGRFVEGAIVPDNIFQIFMDPMDKNYFRFSLGFLARFNQGPSALIQYRTVFNYENVETHSITTQLRWEF